MRVKFDKSVKDGIKTISAKETGYLAKHNKHKKLIKKLKIIVTLSAIVNIVLILALFRANLTEYATIAYNSMHEVLNHSTYIRNSK